MWTTMNMRKVKIWRRLTFKRGLNVVGLGSRRGYGRDARNYTYRRR